MLSSPIPTLDLSSGQALYSKARALIPGGVQLLSKRPEMFLPEQWPAYFSRAKGSLVWDLDGRQYTDVSHFGVGTCPLGFANEAVDQAVVEAIRAGNMCTLNCPEEVRLAEVLVELHPWADMARFARGGGDAMAVAVRIARARTGRDDIAFCGYHGWHDWYLSANLSHDRTLDGHLLAGLSPVGTPRGLTGTALPFHYNRIEELRAIARHHEDRLAAIVMEPIRGHQPQDGFLEEVREIATSVGAVLVFDEVTSGWRMNTGGVHMTLGITPDIAVFAKGMSNGYPMAAVVGTADVMEASQDTFISSTYWTDRIGPVAALATIEEYRRKNVTEHLVQVGNQVQAGWKQAAAECGLELQVDGIAPLSHFSIPHDDALAAITLFNQILLDHGFLASNQFYASLAHEPAQIEAYIQVVSDAFGEIATALQKDDARSRLRGPVKHGGFQRLAQ